MLRDCLERAIICGVVVEESGFNKGILWVQVEEKWCIGVYFAVSVEINHLYHELAKSSGSAVFCTPMPIFYPKKSQQIHICCDLQYTKAVI